MIHVIYVLIKFASTYDLFKYEIYLSITYICVYLYLFAGSVNPMIKNVSILHKCSPLNTISVLATALFCDEYWSHWSNSFQQKYLIKFLLRVKLWAYWSIFPYIETHTSTLTPTQTHTHTHTHTHTYIYIYIYIYICMKGEQRQKTERQRIKKLEWQIYIQVIKMYFFNREV